MKRKNTRKALVSSVFALLLCVSMLVGNTFAWFTDTATTGINKIQAGTLDIDLEMWNGEKWVSAAGETLKFVAKDGREKILWEPGCTYSLPTVRVINKGNLALKYTVQISGVVGDSDSTVDLSEVLELSMSVNGTKVFPKEGEVVTLKDALTSQDPDGFAHGNLKAGENSGELTISLHMQETAGNEYQKQEISGISVTVYAAQDTVEYDSNDNQYDQDAPLIVAEKVYATTSSDDIIELLQDGKNIYVAEDITLDNGEKSMGITLDKDVAIYAAEGAKLTFKQETTVLGTGSITVYGGSLTGPSLAASGNSTLIFEGGNHTINVLWAVENGTIVVNAGTINCNGEHGGEGGGFSFRANGQLYVNGGTLNLDAPIRLSRNLCDKAYVEINGGTINLGVDKLFTVRNKMTKDETSGVLRGSSIKITGGVFYAGSVVDNTGDANAFIRNEDTTADTTRVLVSNTHNGETQYNCSVTGGTFYGNWQRTGETGGGGTEVCENTIAGFVADGYQMTGDSTNGYVVSKIN